MLFDSPNFDYEYSPLDPLALLDSLQPDFGLTFDEPDPGYGLVYPSYHDVLSASLNEGSVSSSSTTSNPNSNVLYDLRHMYTPPTSTFSPSSVTFNPPAELYQGIVSAGEIVPEHTPRQTARSPIASYLDDTESEGNGTDDEYIPSPALRPVRRRGASGTTRTRARARAAPYSTISIPVSPLATSTQRRRFPRRNVHVQAPQAQPTENNKLQCPHCTHYQQDRRVSDLKRHIKTHFAEEWVCCGFPTADGTPQMVHNGVGYAGGCGDSFSRRDALQRHLSKTKKKCVGDQENLEHCLVLVA